MPEPSDKLAKSLEELRRLQLAGARVFASKELSRTHRERLVKHGFLLEVMNGWLVSTSPGTKDGDTTPWFSSFWEFCRRYCGHRFGDSWHLSAEQSLLIHAESTVIPKQVVVFSPHANNARTDLAFNTSLFAVKESTFPPDASLEDKHGLRVFTAEAALIRVTAEFFAVNSIDARIILQRLRDPSRLLALLLEGGHSTVAGRLAGAFRHIGNGGAAAEIIAAMKDADFDVRESDPFSDAAGPVTPVRSVPPVVVRLQELWRRAREVVAAELPPAPGLPKNRRAFMQSVEEAYGTDAYHSLSIEGYVVSAELIARVSAGKWNPDSDPADRANANALAARGYWQAFQRVRDAVAHVLGERGDIDIIRSSYRQWYRELFAPHVAAGMLPASMLAGLRTQPVYIRGSRHVPPRTETVPDAMSGLFDLVEEETHPGVRAVLAHWLLGYVHPFPDGNGRVARFVMNALFAGGGYPWTVIHVEDRAAYLSALERASVDGDARPFARFIADQMAQSTAKPPSAKRAKRTRRRRRP